MEKQGESLNHILWNCSVGYKLWEWIVRIFGVGYGYQNLKQTIEMYSGRSGIVKQIWVTVVLCVIMIIWKHMNARIFYYENMSIRKCKHEIRKMVLWTVNLIKEWRHCTGEDELTQNRMGSPKPISRQIYMRKF